MVWSCGIEREEGFVGLGIEVVVNIAEDSDAYELSSFGVAVVSVCDFSGCAESVDGGDSSDLDEVVEFWVFGVYGSDHSFCASDIVVDFVCHWCIVSLCYAACLAGRTSWRWASMVELVVGAAPVVTRVSHGF